MGLQPSASVTGLLLACQRPFDPNVKLEPNEPGESARYGSAWHFVTAECLRKPKLLKSGAYAKTVDFAALRWEVKASAGELAGHVKSSLGVLQNWLTREKLKVEGIEASYAYTPSKPETREIVGPNDEGGPRYDIRLGEIGLTLDLLAYGESRVVVIDHKTGTHDGDWFVEGASFALPDQLPQMKTIGAALMGAHAGEMHVGIFHADRQGLPAMYTSELSGAIILKHDKALVQALGRVGDGSMRPGPYCKRCPARGDCPAAAADLLGESTQALVEASLVLADEPIDPRRSLAPRGAAGMTIEQRAAAMYKLFKKYDVLREAGREELKRLVKAGAVVETDGGVLELRVESFETLSKASIFRAFGKPAGEKLIASLRKKGVVEQSTREKIVPGKD